MRLLALSLIVDGTDVSEPFTSFEWVKALGERFDVTLLCLQRDGRASTAAQLPHVRVVTWREPRILRHAERVRAMVQPGWPILTWHAKRWLTATLAGGERFDVAHQLFPQAMRHRCPFRDFDIPYVIGPLGGSLETPPAFVDEVGTGSVLSRLRELDRLRFRYDGALRASYERAGALLGVAPYVRDVLGGIRLKRFETVIERAAAPLAQGHDRSTVPGAVKLLHVGRTVRTKGLRDAVRAMAHLRDLSGVTLTSAGDGEDLENCRREAESLGVADRVTFLGLIPREEVEDLYATHDVFLFPSFREPMGGVFFEAMRWGLPTIGARRGGPEAIVDDDSGILIDVTTPEQFALDLANAARALAFDPERRRQLGQGAHARLASFGTWPEKTAQMEALYREVIAAKR